MTVETIDRSHIPGAMAEQLSRTLPDGSLIEFETAPAGWLTKDGEAREKPWRAYHYTTASHTCTSCGGGGRLFDKSERGRKCPPCDGTGDGAKRTRFESVTGIVDATCPKPGLPPWKEARGIEGAIEAVRRGLIDPSNPEDVANAVDIVRANGLGGDAAAKEAADRGLNTHDVLRAYMETGTPPSLFGQPTAHHGFLMGASRWLLKAGPEPVAVEQLVVHPEHRYAGRLDLRAYIGGLLTTVDFKTQADAGIYLGAHVQTALYELAAIRCGGEPADRRLVVVLAEDGGFREMEATHGEGFHEAALAWRRECKPVDAACEAQNRIEKAARAAA